MIQDALKGAKLIEGKVVVITGAALGIGRACARMFSNQGGLLALVDLSGQALKEVCRKIELQGNQVVGIEADITIDKDIDRVFQVAQERYGRLDILVNNAGGGRPTDFFEIDAEEWNKVVMLNLTSAFLVSQRAARIFRKQRHGVIVNLSSQAGRSVSPTAGCHYTASKTGLLGLSRHMAKALAPFNIRVNAVCPGITNTERIAKRLEEKGTTEEIKKTIPLGRIGEVDEIAACCLFLASDLSQYITGATLDVNGGSLMI